MRDFKIEHATRKQVPLLIGLMGPSGSGKTYSALRLATGIKRISGGDIYMIDTESRRSLHYADKFNFEFLEFTPPFSSLDYLSAIEKCVKAGAKIIIVDSMSHEHEGPGGHLEAHEAEVDRLAKSWGKQKGEVTFPAWAVPKADRRRLINTILQMPIAAGVFCFRAKEKMKMPKKGERAPTDLGWMAIAGEEFIYEMTINCVLYPGSRGTPSWNPDPDLAGETKMVKLPEQFTSIFAKPRSLDEDIGEAMAQWAAGGKPPSKKADAKSVVSEFLKLGISAESLERRIGHPIAELNSDELSELRDIYANIKADPAKIDIYFAPTDVVDRLNQGLLK